ncbi:MAG: hypothetical protein CVU56_14610 [Deltaproteobacteria bacterium HGW-Deltaproteobacteria-14]|nr:MAG: hypothetical protein CVU56_14610 [Deltaproteobacteria bacterium HGW-Deltaproteobacteria-14]
MASDGVGEHRDERARGLVWGLYLPVGQGGPTGGRLRGDSATFGLQGGGGSAASAFSMVGHSVPLRDDNQPGSLFMSFTPQR